MDCTFDIIEYLSGLTGFVFDKAVLKRIAMDRGVLNVKLPSELNKQQKDLLLADLLYVAYMSPYQTPSFTKQHGAFTQTVGSQTINDKQGIYEMMMAIYKKYNDEKLDMLLESSTLQWLE